MLPLFLSAALLSSFPGVSVGKIHDGDTFQVDLPGLAPVFGAGIPVRIRGLDTAEISDQRACVRADAEAAKSELEGLIKDQKVELLACSRDKFFRLDCTVMLGSIDVGKRLLAKKLARVYNGGTKTDWVCSRR